MTEGFESPREAQMRAYVATSGLMFFLIVVAHIARIAADGLDVLKGPTFVLASCISLAMLAWSIVAFRRTGGRGAG